MNRYNEYKNRDTQYQIARLDDELDRIQRRIESAVKEKPVSEESKYYNDYITQLKNDLSNLKKQKKEITSLKPDSIIDPISLKLVRDSLKSFASNIKIFPPDQQYQILKTYINQIVLDHITGSFKLSLIIHDPQNSNENNSFLLQKTIYIPLH